MYHVYHVYSTYYIHMYLQLYKMFLINECMYIRTYTYVCMYVYTDIYISYSTSNFMQYKKLLLQATPQHYYVAMYA